MKARLPNEVDSATTAARSNPEICDQPPQLPDLIPDGVGGVLARVTYTTSAGSGGNYTYQTRVSRITPAGVQYTNNLHLNDYFSPMMAGDDGTALVFTNAAWHLKDVTNWSTLWSNSNTRLQPVTATLDRGVAMLDIDTRNLIHFNAMGVVEDSTPFGGSQGYQSAFGLWTSSESGLTARYSLNLNESAMRFNGLGTGQASPKIRTFATRESAALMALDYLYPLSAKANWEYGGFVCNRDGRFIWSRFVTDMNQSAVTLPANLCGSDIKAARLHTHPPKENAEPSGDDIGNANATANLGVPSYLRAPIPDSPVFPPIRQRDLKYWNDATRPAQSNICVRTDAIWQPLVSSLLYPSSATANCATPQP